MYDPQSNASIAISVSNEVKKFESILPLAKRLLYKLESY